MLASPALDATLDLAMARAAVAGDTEAIAKLEAGPFRQARAHLAARKFAAWIVEEAIQQTRIALLVEGGLARYTGSGSLAAYVRVVATRLALKATPTRGDDAIADQLDDSAPTPELATLKATYGELVREAVLEAWRSIPAHDRFVLSLELHGRMSIQSIAALYNIHKVSAARKLSKSRDVLLDAVRSRLRDRMGTSLETVDSVLRLVSFPVSPSDLSRASGV